MGEIVILPDDISAKIAAGEVIERPVSVVKELVENSVDANAKRIEVYIANGGKKLIEVRDDGDGILKEDLSIVFERHSTSKIKSLKDLESIKTLGFRGEALRSIGEISRTTIISSKKGSDETNMVTCIGGEIGEVEPYSILRGTIVRVEDIFFNLPARKKFLRSDETEFYYIKDIILKIASAHPEIEFILFHNKKKVLSLNRRENYRERMADIFGKKFNENYFYEEFSIGQLKIKAFLISPGLKEVKKQPQWLFLNGRFAKERVIQKAISSSYQGLLQKGISPGYIFFVELPPDEIEVNIHPKKEEVRVKSAKRIFKAIRRVLRSFLEKRIEERISYSELSYTYSFYEKREDKNKFNDFPSKEKELLFERKRDEKNEVSSPLFFEENELKIRIYGQFLKSYIIAEVNGKLLIVDQHNAEERVNYDRLKSKYESQKLFSVEPLFPIVLSVEIDDVVEEKIRKLRDFGWEVELWGENSIVVRKFPELFSETNIEEFINEYIKSDYDEEPQDFILKLMACKSSVKVNTYLSNERMLEIVKNLLKSSNPYLCPHSRPIIVEIDEDFIKKALKRK